MRTKELKQFNPNDYVGQALIALTYEDGLASQFEHAVPLHLRYGIPATFAIIASRLVHPSHWNQHMFPFQVAELPRLGFEIVSSYEDRDEKSYGELSGKHPAFDMAESQKFLQGYANGVEVSSISVPASIYEGKIAGINGKYYRMPHMAGKRVADISKLKNPGRSLQARSRMLFDMVKRIIDQTVESRQCAVLMLHEIAATAPRTDTEISSALLEQILGYITSFERQTLLPLRLCDIPHAASMRPESLKILNAPKARGAVRKKTEELSASRKKPSAARKLNRFARASDITNFLSAPREKTISSMTLVEADDFLITYHKNTLETDTVIISFGGLPSKKTPTGFGSSFALSNGFDHIFVAQREMTQYQGLSLGDFKKAVSPAIKGRKAVTYGSSLGAYCAIYYGGCINAQIVSAAPKNSAHPMMLKKAFAGMKFKHRNYADNPLSSKKPVIIYDPYREEETEFIKAMVKPAYPEANYVELPFAGHTVLQTMKHSDVLKDFIFGILNKGKPPEISLKKEDSHIWHAEKGRHLYGQNRFEQAEKHLLKSLELLPNEDALELLMLAYAGQNKMQEAVHLLEKARGWFPQADLVKRLRNMRHPFGDFVAVLAKSQVNADNLLVV